MFSLSLHSSLYQPLPHPLPCPLPQRLIPWDSVSCALASDGLTHPHQCPGHQPVPHCHATSDRNPVQPSLLPEGPTATCLPTSAFQEANPHFAVWHAQTQCPPGHISSTSTASMISSYPFATSLVTAEKSLCSAFRGRFPQRQC